MNDKDLPELNIPKFNKRKKEKKVFLPWLFGGGKTGTFLGGMGSVGARGVGTGLLGSGAGGAAGGGAGGILSSIFAGKAAAVLIALGVTGAAVGIGLVISKFSSPNIDTSVKTAMSSMQDAEDYVPAIHRQAQSKSALAMLAERNKGKVLDIGRYAQPETPEYEPSEASDGPPSIDVKQTKPDQTNMADEIKQMMGANFGNLSSSLGGGSSGKFGNKFSKGFNQAGVGSSGIMGTFQKPEFGKSGQLLAMRKGRSASFKEGKIGRRKTGPGAYNQAKGVKTGLKGSSGMTTVDSLKHTEDMAWEGQTSEGEISDTGTGVGDGEASIGGGIVTSPSLDNVPVSNVDTDYDGAEIGEQNVPDPGEGQDTTPWNGMAMGAIGMLMMANMLILIAGILMMIAKALKSNPLTAALAAMLEAIARMLAIAALIMGMLIMAVGVMMMTKFGQKEGGMIFTIAGGITTAAAAMVLAGGAGFAVMAMVMAGISGVVGMIGGFLG